MAVYDYKYLVKESMDFEFYINESNRITNDTNLILEKIDINSGGRVVINAVARLSKLIIEITTRIGELIEKLINTIKELTEQIVIYIQDKTNKKDPNFDIMINRFKGDDKIQIPADKWKSDLFPNSKVGDLFSVYSDKTKKAYESVFSMRFNLPAISRDMSLTDDDLNKMLSNLDSTFFVYDLGKYNIPDQFKKSFFVSPKSKTKKIDNEDVIEIDADDKKMVTGIVKDPKGFINRMKAGRNQIGRDFSAWKRNIEACLDKSKGVLENNKFVDDGSEEAHKKTNAIKFMNEFYKKMYKFVKSFTMSYTTYYRDFTNFSIQYVGYCFKIFNYFKNNIFDSSEYTTFRVHDDSKDNIAVGRLSGPTTA